MRPKAKRVPFGILEVRGALWTIICGTSRETRDFIADCLQQWWPLSQDRSPHMRPWGIDLDNGPQNARCRTQFMNRMVECADRHSRFARMKISF